MGSEPLTLPPQGGFVSLYPGNEQQAAVDGVSCICKITVVWM